LQKDGSAEDSFLLTIDKKSLRERIEDLEYIANCSKKSHLLNQHSNSNKLSVKHTDKESISIQKDIEDLYRSIERNVFGREKERKHICCLLRKGPNAEAASSSTSKCYSVVGIYGIAGSGKSTLAQYVCDYEEAEGNHFNLVMFIHVSKTFRLADIFRDMLEQISRSRPSGTKGLKSLCMELKGNLKGRCFLLVLDDLWVHYGNQKEWHIFLDAINAGQRGSRILVTAQTKDAAAALGAQEQIPIPDLGEDHYLSLFMHHAIQAGSVGYDVEYERIGRRIVEKLHRSPMAAVTVAKRLQRNKSLDFWERTANLDVLNETMGALWWSYQQLGTDIRRCFEYCSTFPRGYMLKRDMLVHLWIAQGFVKTSATEDMEALGNRYFDELLTFSFLQMHRTVIGTQQFTIHDLLHELLERVAGSDFFRIDVNNGLPKEIPAEVRHLFVETYDRTGIIERILDLANLRTLILEELDGSMSKMLTAPPFKHTGYNDLSNQVVFESMLMRLRKLRVLIVRVRGYHNKLSFLVPSCIDQLKHLRYFRFRSPNYVNLIIPSTFSKLYHMQILDAPDLRLSCAEDVADLIHLRHCYPSLNLPNIGRLTQLQTMPHFRVGKEPGYELRQLKYLNSLGGTLRISGLGTVGGKEEALEAQLPRKKRLNVLVLDFNEKIYGDHPDVEAVVLEGLCPPEHLVQLCIWWYCGSMYPSWMLNHQHSDAPKHLDKLELCECRRLVSIPQGSEFFVHLRLLRIVSCGWDSLPDNMEKGLRSLQKLVIRSCRNIELLPTLPPSLQEITLVDVGKLRTSCKERGHRNWLKIEHIPNKKLYE
jgi:hypothetical protein